MAEIQSTPKFSISGAGVKSALRHTVVPLVAGSAMAALRTAQSGTFDVAAMKGAAVTSAIAGFVRLLQVFVGPHEGVR